MSETIKQSTVKPERPGGFIDYLPAEFLAREKMIGEISKIFRSFGFDPIETPRVEFLKTLSGEESDTGKNIFVIKSKVDNEPLAMPFDHTVPFARLLAANPYHAKKRTGIRLPWRRMVVGPVFRGEKPQAGRFRQFYQFDADIAGTDSMLADTEIVAMIYRTLTALGVDKFLVRLNNRKILNGLAILAGIKERDNASAEDITREMMRILDKIDKVGFDGVAEELAKKAENAHDVTPELKPDAIIKIKSFLDISGNNLERLAKAKKLFIGVSIALEGIDELEQIITNLDICDIPEKYVKVDFSIARGLDYYTGPVMETVLLEAREFGSIFGGGRYDELVKRFTGEDLPSVGASIGVDRFFAALRHLGVLNLDQKSVSEVMILRLAKDKDSEYLKVANEIRSLGFNTELCLLGDTTFKSQFNYAISRGVKYAVICGEDEFANNKISIKDLDVKKQVSIDRNKLIDYFNNI